MAKKNRLKNCLKQIEIVEPNSNLADGFIIKAETSLGEMRTAKSKDWKITTGYYTMYQAVYSIFMKTGIKSEVHVCTIELFKKLFPEYFEEKEFNLLEKAFEARKDVSYYVNREVKDETLKEILDEAPKILAKCKAVLLKLNEKKVNEIRNEIKNLREKNSS